MSKKPFDPTKPVQTRDGRSVRILCTDRKNANYPIIALIGEKEELVTRMVDGKSSTLYLHADDLVNIPERRSEFRRVFNDGSYGTKSDKKIPYEIGSHVYEHWKGYIEFVYEDDILVDVKYHKKDSE